MINLNRYNFQSPENYNGVPLESLPPKVGLSTIEHNVDHSLLMLETWAPYKCANPTMQAVIRDMVEMNILNAGRHNEHENTQPDVVSPSTDENRVAKGMRPEAVLRMPHVKSVELQARIIGSDNSPHDVIAGDALKDYVFERYSNNEFYKIGDNDTRTRIKATRAIGALLFRPKLAVLRSKVDRQLVTMLGEIPENNYDIEVKARRTGFVMLDYLSKEERRPVMDLVKFDEHPDGDDEELKAAIIETLQTKPEAYQGLVDRVYATEPVA